MRTVNSSVALSLSSSSTVERCVCVCVCVWHTCHRTGWDTIVLTLTTTLICKLDMAHRDNAQTGATIVCFYYKTTKT